jgi:hypothetical protein
LSYWEATEVPIGGEDARKNAENPKYEGIMKLKFVKMSGL